MNVSDRRLVARLKLWCRMIANMEPSGTSCKVVREKTDLSEEGLDSLLDTRKMAGA